MGYQLDAAAEEILDFVGMFGQVTRQQLYRIQKEHKQAYIDRQIMSLLRYKMLVENSGYIRSANLTEEDRLSFRKEDALWAILNHIEGDEEEFSLFTVTQCKYPAEYIHIKNSVIYYTVVQDDEENYSNLWLLKERLDKFSETGEKNDVKIILIVKEEESLAKIPDIGYPVLVIKMVYPNDVRPGVPKIEIVGGLDG